MLETPDKDRAREFNKAPVHSYIDKIDGLLTILVNDYQKDIKLFDRFRLFVLGLFFLSAVFIVLYIKNSIVIPLRRLKDTTSEIEKGNFGVELDINTRDEIYQLGGTYTRMVNTLKNLFNEKSEHIQELDALYKIAETAIQTLSVEDTLNKVMDSILGLSQLRLEKRCHIPLR